MYLNYWQEAVEITNPVQGAEALTVLVTLKYIFVPSLADITRQLPLPVAAAKVVKSTVDVAAALPTLNVPEALTLPFASTLNAPLL